MTQFERSDWLRSENFMNIMIECIITNVGNHHRYFDSSLQYTMHSPYLAVTFPPITHEWLPYFARKGEIWMFFVSSKSGQFYHLIYWMVCNIVLYYTAIYQESMIFCTEYTNIGLWRAFEIRLRAVIQGVKGDLSVIRFVSRSLRVVVHTNVVRGRQLAGLYTWPYWTFTIGYLWWGQSGMGHISHSIYDKIWLSRSKILPTWPCEISRYFWYKKMHRRLENTICGSISLVI